MPSWRSVLMTLLLVSLTSISAASRRGTGRPSLRRRDPALPTSPSGNYAPVYTQCPPDLFVRAPNELKGTGQTQLGKGEAAYIKEKAAQSIPLWQKYLETVNLEHFNVEEFLKPAKQNGGVAALTLPNLGFSLSGGSDRALCFSGSILDSFDARNDKANEAKVGGILQLANYAVAVSGASWLLGSWATSNFPRISTLVPTWRLSEANDLWDWNIVKDYWSDYRTVQEKHKAGFPVSLVDVWGRIISRHFINEPEKKTSQKGKAVLWSSIRQTPQYKNRDAPFVMAVTTSRPDKGKPFTPESPTYEFTAEEFGILHPSLNASIPIEYLGSAHSTAEGSVPHNCVAGFDNAGFVMGMSSNIFSTGDSPKGEKRPKHITAMRIFIKNINFEGKVPNPFKGLGKTAASSAGGGYQDSDRDLILMADSGLIHENIPLFPLIQPERKVDVLIALDASADGNDKEEPSLYSYPNGTQLYSIFTKTKLPSYHGYHMPNIPNAIDGTFNNLGYNKRPTFFGCDDFKGPLIVYLPNYYATDRTNTATNKLTYTPQEIDDFMRNGFALATQTLGPTQNKEWPSCLACALVDRQVLRNSATRTAQCQACFKNYCATP